MISPKWRQPVNSIPRLL